MGFFTNMMGNKAAATITTKEIEIETEASLDEIETSLKAAGFKTKNKKGNLAGSFKKFGCGATAVAAITDGGDIRAGAITITGPAAPSAQLCTQIKLQLRKIIK